MIDARTLEAILSDQKAELEARLIGIALAGGSIGAMLSMKVWHHKTQHKKFSFGLPFILILQIAAVVIIFHLLEKWSCL